MNPHKFHILKKAMGSRSLTRFAQDAGISAGNFSRIARGQNASPEVMRKIANASNKQLSYERIARLFGYIPEGKLTKEEYIEFSSILSLELKSNEIDGDDLFFYHDDNFNLDTLYNWSMNTDFEGDPDETEDWPTYEDVYCTADLLDVSAEYLLGKEPEGEKKESEITTIAAHIDRDLTVEEQQQVMEFAKYIKSRRKKNAE